MTIRLDTSVGDVLPWIFVPAPLDVKVTPGETALSFFTLTNHSNKPITGVVAYNVYLPRLDSNLKNLNVFALKSRH
jgi:cytochrome c oxidase assembly protein subunit 11